MEGDLNTVSQGVNSKPGSAGLQISKQVHLSPVSLLVVAKVSDSNPVIFLQLLIRSICLPPHSPKPNKQTIPSPTLPLANI